MKKNVSILYFTSWSKLPGTLRNWALTSRIIYIYIIFKSFCWPTHTIQNLYLDERERERERERALTCMPKPFRSEYRLFMTGKYRSLISLKTGYLSMHPIYYNFLILFFLMDFLRGRLFCSSVWGLMSHSRIWRCHSYPWRAANFDLYMFGTHGHWAVRVL